MDINENRLKNIKLVSQMQNNIESRMSECISELARAKNGDGADEVSRMVESIIYRLEEEMRFVYKDVVGDKNETIQT